MADFIRAETIEGIQRLYTLRLQGAPPEDGVVATAEVWVAALKKRFAREIELEQRIDASVIGGAVIDAGDVVIDGSVRGRLERLQSALAQ